MIANHGSAQRLLDVLTARIQRKRPPRPRDREIAAATGSDEDAVRAARLEAGIVPAYKRIDTCAAEFESFTPYLYGSYEFECEADPTARQKVVILGSGPNRIGQGLEFDYCCCHAAFALREEGFETLEASFPAFHGANRLLTEALGDGAT